jgi:hypothetical protein
VERLLLSETMVKYIGVALSADGAGDNPPLLKRITLGSATRDEVEAGLQELLRTRDLTILDWENLNYVAFDSEDDLYRYLQKVYDYIFRDAEEAPELP